MAVTETPTPHHREQRICFGISWFTDEADAESYARAVRAAGTRYNGGFFHGRPCDRDKSFDYTEDGTAYYAVTD